MGVGQEHRKRENGQICPVCGEPGETVNGELDGIALSDFVAGISAGVAVALRRVSRRVVMPPPQRLLTVLAC